MEKKKKKKRKKNIDHKIEQEDAPCWFVFLGRPRGANLNSIPEQTQKKNKEEIYFSRY